MGTHKRRRLARGGCARLFLVAEVDVFPGEFVVEQIRLCFKRLRARRTGVVAGVDDRLAGDRVVRHSLLAGSRIRQGISRIFGCSCTGIGHGLYLQKLATETDISLPHPEDMHGVSAIAAPGD
jgi:hypothetical protein